MSLSVGLDRKSPVPLEGNPRKFEGLIERHGQWVRWSIARKCTCLLANNRPDPRCALCRGSGWRYTFQESDEDIEVQAAVVGENTVEMPYTITRSTVVSVRTPAGVKLSIQGVYGKWIKVSGAALPMRGTVLVAVLNPRRKTVPATSAVYAGHGIVKLDEYEYENPWARVPFDLVAVDSVKRADGAALTVLSWSVDKVLIDETVLEPAVGERLSIEAAYMPPFRMAVVNQNLSEADRNFLRDVGGDAMAVFPFSYKVSEYDTVTLWAGQQVRKKIIRRSLDDTDTMPDLFVSRILSLSDAERAYQEGVDFTLWDRNTIRWLSATRPADSAYYSIEYMANVTYRVLPQLPNIRSSEDKRFPSRVALKLETGTTGSDQV